MDQAKYNLINEYFLVGVTEELEDFIMLLEAALPRFFRGATDLYRTGIYTMGFFLKLSLTLFVCNLRNLCDLKFLKELVCTQGKLSVSPQHFQYKTIPGTQMVFSKYFLNEWTSIR